MASSTLVAAALLMVALLSQVAAESDNSMSQSIGRRYTPTANSTWTALRNNGSGWCLTPNEYRSTPGAVVNNFNCYAYMPGPQGFAPETHRNFYMWGFTNSTKHSWLVYNLGGLCITASSAPLTSGQVTLQTCDCASKFQLFKPSLKTGQIVLGYHPRLTGVNSTCHAQTYKNVTASAFEEELDYDDELEKPVKSKVYLCLSGANTAQGGGVNISPCNTSNPLQVWKFEPFIYKKAVMAE